MDVRRDAGVGDMDRIQTEKNSMELKFAEHLKNLTQIGKALSAERNIDRLLEMILDEARSFTNADGGTLYIMDEERKMLRFGIVQNDSLKVRMGGTAESITWPPVQLYNEDESPNYANVSSYSALSGDIVNIPDVYHAEKFDFEGTRKFDANTGYRSQSMLVVPMKNHEDDIIGVLQLLNAKDGSTGKVINFSAECQALTESLASQAAVALTNNILIKNLENLFESFIKSIATAIDEKSPYTGSHGRRVVGLTMEIAKVIDNMKTGYFKDIHFDEDQMDELRIAAWLHDVGKVAVPEYVMDKAKKLESLYDGIELVKARFEVIKRDIEIRYSGISGIGGAVSRESAPDEYKREIQSLKDDLDFIERMNSSSKFVTDEDLQRMRSIAAKNLSIDGGKTHFLTDAEVDNLSVRKGTLNDRERDIMNSHTTIAFKMLSQIPFPRRFKNVPFFVVSHHERLNGEGYPNGMSGDELPLQARILAFADVFEALTARDRPYREGKTLLSQAIKILGFMVKDGHLDSNLFDLFVKEGIYLKYAKAELDPDQIDDEMQQLPGRA